MTAALGNTAQGTPFATGVDAFVYPQFIGYAMRAPTTNDIYNPGTRWQDNSVNPAVIYQTTGGGLWNVDASSGTPVFTSLTVNGTSALTGPTTVTGNLTVNGNIIKNVAGNKDIYTSVATTTAAGANSAGTVTLVAGTATVATTAVTAASIIRLYRQSIGSTGAAALGEITIGARTAGTSFVINAASITSASTVVTTDVSSIGWEIVN